MILKYVYFEIVEDRSAATLLPLIQQYIKAGSTIISDCWKSYDKHSSLGYKHQTVNHSVEFADNATGAYTQTTESTWHPKLNTKTVFAMYRNSKTII